MSDESRDKQINISVDRISLNQSRIPLDSKTIHLQNKMLRKQNMQLKKQLQSFSIKLDSEITKRLELAKKKDIDSTNDGVSQLQLQNAYKKYQIYKKEAMNYKKKYQNLNEDSSCIEDLQRKVAQYQKENNQLKGEVKQLNKIMKQQSKGLAEIGIENYPSIVNQRDQLKQQVRFLKKQLDNYRRARDSIKVKSDSFDFKQRKGVSIQKIGLLKKEVIQRNRFKSENQTIAHEQNTADLLLKKADKNRQKIKYLQNDRNKLRELVDNLKTQLAQKQKQNAYLKDKVNQLRMNNQLLNQQVFIKPGNKKQNKVKKLKLKSKHKYVESQPSQPVVDKQFKKTGQKAKKKIKKYSSSQNELISHSRVSSFLVRREESGKKGSNVLKWSHQHLSSKIKQFQILEHEQGHIKDIHVRYQKGEPKKYNSGPPQNYKIFCCSETQYIKSVQGVFDQGYLQSLKVTSSQNRIQQYGKYQEYSNSIKGQNFRFEVGQYEFPGAIFGQHDQYGIKKLGCFIHKQN